MSHRLNYPAEPEHHWGLIPKILARNGKEWKEYSYNRLMSVVIVTDIFAVEWISSVSTDRVEHRAEQTGTAREIRPDTQAGQTTGTQLLNCCAFVGRVKGDKRIAHKPGGKSWRIACSVRAATWSVISHSLTFTSLQIMPPGGSVWDG